MDLILWRHADAQDLLDHGDDMARALTSRGEKQAARMARWLDRQLPEGTKILVSPARRCEQTVKALERKYKVSAYLSPGGTVAQLLEAAQWPGAKQTVLIVGHQPVLGQTIAQLLDLAGADIAVKRGAVWWLRSRMRANLSQTVVVTVQSPEIL